MLGDNDVLEFDTERLRSHAATIKGIADDLASDQKQLSDDLAQLREDWQTGAGAEFFKKYDDKWVEQVNTHIELLNDLVESLNYAAGKYEELKL